MKLECPTCKAEMIKVGYYEYLCPECFKEEIEKLKKSGDYQKNIEEMKKKIVESEKKINLDLIFKKEISTE